MTDQIKVIDLFAGPGGLGEGFASFKASDGHRPYKIIVSAEKDKWAHRTLKLRAFFRKFESGDQVPEIYYEYASGRGQGDFQNAGGEIERKWNEAEAEAQNLSLGDASDDGHLYSILRDNLSEGEPWILIGGPPCQAYSMAGRVRNRSKSGYRPELDERHFLYRNYLKIIREFKPTVFLMENVKGILSSRVAGSLIFERILGDLSDPWREESQEKGSGPRYRLFSLTTGEWTYDNNAEPRDFVVRSEDHGIPQRRHRVFVIGIREDWDVDVAPNLVPFAKEAPNVGQVIGDLPKLRSGLSGCRLEGGEAWRAWRECVLEKGYHLQDVLRSTVATDLFDETAERTASEIEGVTNRLLTTNHQLNQSVMVNSEALYGETFSSAMPEHLVAWFRNERLHCFSNHITRRHIASDLERYLFVSAWASVTGISPKSAQFPELLAPRHDNWASGQFADRFRVQAKDRPATTITSHISKDGHYYIHYDITQCRSLTVREAARIQTFPDDYLFEGPRTDQFVQVGNAVPPFLARQIAESIFKVLSK